MSKDLKEKAIDIKGKKYVLVSDRIIYFNETYKNGSILTQLVSDVESENVVVKATVIPDIENVNRTFTGYSQAIKGDGFINKTAALENAETSAVGRALAMMGIGVIESIASADEINKAQGSEGKPTMKLATEKQIEWLRKEARQVTTLEHEEDVDKFIMEVLTVPPDHVPINKVKTAVDKIREAGRTKIIDKDDLDEIPY